MHRKRHGLRGPSRSSRAPCSSPARRARASPPPPATAGDAARRPREDFQQVTLAKGAAETGEPMSLAVLPDRSVLHTSRDGDPAADRRGRQHQASSGKLAVYSHDEEGLQGVGVDPDFAENRVDLPLLRAPAEHPRR